MSSKEKLAALMGCTRMSAVEMQYKRYSKLSDADIANLNDMVHAGTMKREYSIDALLRVVEERPHLQLSEATG